MLLDNFEHVVLYGICDSVGISLQKIFHVNKWVQWNARFKLHLWIRGVMVNALALCWSDQGSIPDRVKNLILDL